jgi:hypothetical protein
MKKGCQKENTNIEGVLNLHGRVVGEAVADGAVADGADAEAVAAVEDAVSVTPWGNGHV